MLLKLKLKLEQFLDFVVQLISNLCFKIGTILVELSKSKLTVEQIIVQKVMTQVNNLINYCPFKYLIVTLPIAVPDKPDIQVIYIIKDGYLYEDNHSLISTKVAKDIDLDKYFFRVDGKPKSFLDMERYQVIYTNLDLLTKRTNEEVLAKKKIYNI